MCEVQQQFLWHAPKTESVAKHCLTGSQKMFKSATLTSTVEGGGTQCFGFRLQGPLGRALWNQI